MEGLELHRTYVTKSLKKLSELAQKQHLFRRQTVGIEVHYIVSDLSNSVEAAHKLDSINLKTQLFPSLLWLDQSDVLTKREIRGSFD